MKSERKKLRIEIKLMLLFSLLYNFPWIEKSSFSLFLEKFSSRKESCKFCWNSYFFLEVIWLLSIKKFNFFFIFQQILKMRRTIVNFHQISKFFPDSWIIFVKSKDQISLHFSRIIKVILELRKSSFLFFKNYWKWEQELWSKDRRTFSRYWKYI